MDLENGSSGYISIHRSLQNKNWYSEPDYLSLWIHLLLSANHKDKFIQGIEIKRGQLKTGRNQLAEITGINSSKIERILTFFEESEQQIEQQKTNKFRIITIKKYDDYQNLNSKMNNREQQENSRATTKNTNNNVNNVNNVNNKKSISNDIPKKETKHRYGEFSKVLLTDDERSKLITKIGEDETNLFIEKLDSYIAMKGTTYKSHYHTILTWHRNEEKKSGGQITDEQRRRQKFDAAYARMHRSFSILRNGTQ